MVDTVPGSHKCDFQVPEERREEMLAIGGPLVRNIATPKGSAVIFTEALSHGAAVWQRADSPRYSLFFKVSFPPPTPGERGC